MTKSEKVKAISQIINEKFSGLDQIKVVDVAFEIVEKIWHAEFNALGIERNKNEKETT